MKEIPYCLFSLDQLAELSQLISQALKERHPKDVIVNASANRLKTDVADVHLATVDDKVRKVSQKVAEADQRRDDAYSSLRDHVAAGLKRLNPTYREACERLWTLFLKHGTRLYILPYGEQTEAMKGLFKDLTSQEAQNDLRVINAIGWLDEVMVANEKFEALYESNYTGEGSSSMTTEQAGKQLKATLDVVVSTLKALEAVKDPQGIEETVNNVNAIISAKVEVLDEEHRQKKNRYQDQY